MHVRNGYRSFFFIDETIPPHRLSTLTEIMSNIANNLTWICYLRLEKGHTYELFNAAYQTGLRKVFFGLETASLRLLKLLRKGTTPDDARRVIKDASRAGIAVHLFLMHGFPNESVDDIAATYKFLSDVLPFVNKTGFTYDLFPFMAEIGTEAWKHPQFYGAQGLQVTKRNDMAWRFNFIQNSGSLVSFDTIEQHISQLIESVLGKDTGLRHLELSNDALHLILLDGVHSILQT